MLEVLEHSSEKYTPRTYANAKSAELTAAFAVDFTTAGEKCTKKAATTAGNVFVELPLAWEPVEAARGLYRACKGKARTLNIAGNGIYTLARHGWTQGQANQYVYDALKLVHAHWEIVGIRSGGQTGVDIAGIIAAVALNIPATALLPKGFIQRGTDKIDKQHTKQEVIDQIMQGVVQLKN